MTIERTYRASIEEVWDLWTTKVGIESWWGPEGFVVTVQRLDLRTGGELLYAMTAVAHEQVEYMRKAGMALTTEVHIAYTDVIEHRRLTFTQLADFIPGVEPYNVETMLELRVQGQHVHMVLTIEAMHDEQWTQLALMGRESELRKLENLLELRHASNS
jgi:uncharacterized protein YndB with AHSA1/START domain